MNNTAEQVTTGANTPERFQGTTADGQAVPSDVARRGIRNAMRRGDMLSKHHFFKQMQFEKRRTDRSKTPLSIVLFRVDIRKRHRLGNVREMLDLLRKTKRETDILGYLGDDLIALLLTDTNRPGAEAFTRNVTALGGEVPFSMVAGTYPDQLFEDLIAGHQVPPDTSHLFLDDAVEHDAIGSSVKRAVDIVGAIVGILLLSPLMLITAIAVKVTSPGPVIFKQFRLGKRGVPFVFYKFRSMSTNSDDQIHRKYVENLIKGNLEEVNQGNEANPHFKLKADPRVTPVGRIIRMTSMDELPQLFNVLKGDMSLVGPRPPLTYEAEKYQSWHLRRVLEIRPGITGLWQVEGRNKTSFDDMVRLDLRYIRNWTLWLDLKILAKTVRAVLRCDGEG